MSAGRITGIVILVLGVVLLLFGMNAADSFGEQLREGLTGQFSDTTTLYIIGGILAIVVGCLLAAFAGRPHGMTR